MKYILPLILIYLIPFNAQSQKRLLQFLKEDTSYTLIKGIEKENKIIKLPQELNCGEAKHHYIVKSGLLYVQVDVSGKLYKIDSTGTPVRLDKTCYEGYNFGSYNFTANNKFYSFGGWGFWQFNGALRFFDDSAKEWFVTLLNKDIPFAEFSNGMEYIDFKNNLLYIIFKPTSNSYIKKSESFINDALSVQCLNLTTNKYWDKTRKLSKNLVDYNINIPYFNTSNGLLVPSRNGYILLDFKSEKVYDLKLDADERFQNHFSPKWFIISRDSTIYFYNPETDSLIKAEISLKDFKITNQKLYYDEPQPASYNRSTLIYLSIILLIIAFSFLIYQYQSNKIKKLISEQAKKNGNNGNKQKEINIGHTRLFQDILAEPERLVFELILKKSRQDKFSTIDELNMLLGVKSKESSIQNKVRSDTLQKINQKFMVFGSTIDELIERERTDFDKRLYHYKINRRYINRL